MRRRIAAMSAVVLTLSIFTAGCDQAKQYAGLAQLGSAYAAAIDKLLGTAAAIKIDSTSEKLLADKKLAGTVALESYRKLTAEDEERLKEISRLRAHAQLMGRYFSALSDLSTSTAPDNAATVATGAVQGLEQLGLKLPAGNVISPITKIAVSSVIRGALRRELEERQITIRTELSLQEQLVEVMAEIIRHDITIMKQELEKRQVSGPLMAATGIPNPDEWIASRRMVLNLTIAPDELQTASVAIKKLREAFENLISGKLTVDRVNSLLTDFNTILSVGETLKKDLGGKS